MTRRALSAEPQTTSPRKSCGGRSTVSGRPGVVRLTPTRKCSHSRRGWGEGAGPAARERGLIDQMTPEMLTPYFVPSPMSPSGLQPCLSPCGPFCHSMCPHQCRRWRTPGRVPLSKGLGKERRQTRPGCPESVAAAWRPSPAMRSVPLALSVNRNEIVRGVCGTPHHLCPDAGSEARHKCAIRCF